MAQACRRIKKVTNMNVKPGNRYAFADGLRGLAALWVVFYHLFHGDHVNLLSQFIGATLSAVIFEYGNLGVPIFFVLSGFVMAVTTNSKHLDAAAASRFMQRRFLRLSPPYYFAILLSLIVLFAKSRLEHSDVFPSVPNILAHLFYMQGFFGFKQINVIYWTLCYEMQFYLVFALIMYLINYWSNSERKQLLVILFSTLIGLLWLIAPESVIPDYNFASRHLLFINYWYAFCAGALVGWSIIRDDQFKKYTIFYCSVMMIAAYFKADLFAMMAAATAFLLLLALSYNKMNSWLNQRFLQFLGLISYSLYLIHNNITGILARVVRKFMHPGVVTELMITVVTVIVCLIAAYIMYLVIEKPVVKLSQRIKY
jgi:peptidoglycan/LPS O-acetylase OafA/YrhL